MLQPYSKRSIYALRTLAYAAAMQEQGRFRASIVCREARVPEPFTRKILHLLVESGLLLAHRGPGGGYSLARPPESIVLLDIVSAVDSDRGSNPCIMGLAECGSPERCVMHDASVMCSRIIDEALRQHTLAELVAAVVIRERAGRDVPKRRQCRKCKPVR